MLWALRTNIENGREFKSVKICYESAEHPECWYKILEIIFITGFSKQHNSYGYPGKG